MSIDIVIYHNPACGTSRNVLALIREAGIEPHVVEYLKTPPSRALLENLIARSGQPARALLREKGTPYAELGLDDPALGDAALIDAMIAHPILINRPLVVSPLGVALCRPKERVFDLLPRAAPVSATEAATDVAIRAARPDDATAIAAIYAHHVAHGSATFDTVAPAPDHFAAMIDRFGASGEPFLVAERGGALVGYAYAARFRDRAAYAGTCENSIYLDPDHRGQGIGSALLPALLHAAEAAGFRQMIAVIGGEQPASVRLHAQAGFVHAGRLRAVGRKFGAWLDTVYMQRSLGAGDTAPPAIEP